MTAHDIDPSTGLPRRASFLVQLGEYLAAARQTGVPLSILALDVDHLQYMNYYFGHAAGDAALGMVATVLRAQLPDGVLARVGGDEFYALLPSVTLADALIVAERVRRSAVALPLGNREPRTPPRCLTFSLTVIAYPDHGRDAQELLVRADQGLMAAKRQGRDTVYRVPTGPGVYILLDPDGTRGVGLTAIIAAPTGVTYAHQCGGGATVVRELEGFTVPLGDREAARPVRAFFRRFGGNPSGGAKAWDNVHIGELEEIVGAIPFWHTNRDGAGDCRAVLVVDSARLDSLTEGWIPVHTPYGPGVLLCDNSD